MLNRFGDSLSVAKAGPGKGHKILLLQGPVGPFFRQLQKSLADQGHDVWRATFNAADRIAAGFHKTIRFPGNASHLESWLSLLITDHCFDIVIYFGSERPPHVAARAACKAAGIPCLSLEEGYFRPGYITIEECGNNWMSPLAGMVPPDDQEFVVPLRKDKGRSSLNRMSWYAFKYFALHGFLSNREERKIFHKPSRTHLIGESFCWIRNASRRFGRIGANARVIEHLLEHHPERYVVVPFQVSDDAQLTGQASRGWTNHTMALNLIDSFARCAPPDMQLVFKVHPLERGHADDYIIVREAAELHGVTDRVHILDHGSIGMMTRHSAGMVTINSSSALSAIFHNKPLAVLGRALFSHPDLAYVVDGPDDIDRFWCSQFRREPDLAQRYLKWVRSRSIAAGDYYLKSDMPLAIEAITQRIAPAVRSQREANERAERQKDSLQGAAAPQLRIVNG